MGVYYGMNGLWVPVGGQGGAAPVDPNLLAENIKTGVTISGVTGTFTNDGTATASDMASGATAYVNGEKVTGTIKDSTSGWIFDDSTPKPLPSPQEITYMAMSFSPTIDLILRSGTKCYTRTSPSNFGDATAADVAAGKTFTSSAGLKVIGTGSIGGTIDTSKYTLLTKSESPSTIIDYIDGNSYYTPGIKIFAPELSGKTIYGLHLGVGIYDKDSGENYAYYLSYWNPTATDGAEQIIDFFVNCYNGIVGTYGNVLIPYGRSDIGFNVISYSNECISIAFDPVGTGSSNPIYAKTYFIENYILRVWYK